MAINGESIQLKRKNSSGEVYNMYPVTTMPNVAGLNEALTAKQDQLTFDDAPTEGSENPVKSGGVVEYVSQVVGDIGTVLDKING